MSTSSSAVRRETDPQQPNRLWLVDLTPVSAAVEPLYLAVVLDCYTRRCLGWRFSEQLEPALVEAAVKSAVNGRWPRSFVFDRSPLGRPVALALADRCAAAGVDLRSPEALAKKTAAVAATFFEWLGADLFVSAEWNSAVQARWAITEWIDARYNPAVSSPPIPLPSDSRRPLDAEGRRVEDTG